MTFRATNVLPADALRDAKRLAAHVQSYAQARATAWASGTTADDIFGTVDQMRTHRENFLILRAVPGIAAYAADQENDPAYDVAAEFNGMVTAIETFITNIIALFPVDGNDYLLSHTFNANGERVARSFPGGALAGTIADLNGIVAAIS